MKGRKVLALALALALGLGLWVPASAARTYPDVPEDFWAYSYIEDMTERGLFTGYNNGDFGPEDVITESTGLALCSRLMVVRKSELWSDIVSVRGEEAKVVPDTPAEAWFRADAAVALELGIVSEAELKALVKKGLSTPMTKADFAVYLMRGLGLEEFVQAQDMEDVVLDFNDADEIEDRYLPYVYLLDKFGVLTGDHLGNFNPNQEITRAICATMLSRALKNIAEGRRVAVEFPEYTGYDWVAGTILSIETDGGSRVLVLEDLLTGAEVSVPLPAEVRESIYRYNTPSGWTALQTGAYARVCYGEDNETPVSVRVIPKSGLYLVEGACDAISDKSVRVDGVDYTVNRFSWVSAGGKVGDRKVLDLDAGYREALACVDFYGNVLWLSLQGGTRADEGVLTAVTDSQVTITSFSGVPTVYARSQDLKTTQEGLNITLREVLVGSRVVFRVADADLSQLVSMDVDPQGTYIQGVLRRKDTVSTYPKIYVQRTGAAEEKGYELEKECPILYEKEAITFAELPLSYITARVEGGSITLLSAWQAYEEVVGNLTAIVYGDPTVLKIAKDDGTVTELSVPTARLGEITVTTGGNKSDITKVRTGDRVTVTLLYHEVDRIDYTLQAANINGVLDSVTFNSDGSALLTVNLVGGGTESYAVSANATVMRNGVAVALTDLKVGNTVALVTEGEKALSVDITGSATQKDWVEGSVYLKKDSDRTVVLLTNAVGDSALKTVHIGYGVPMLDVNSGRSLNSVAYLEAGDILQVWGSYTPDGVFEAVSVIRR